MSSGTRSLQASRWSDRGQRGFSLARFLGLVMVVGLSGFLLLRIAPSLLEYWAVDKAIVAAAAVSRNPAELRSAFDKLAAAGYIDAIEGKDLTIDSQDGKMQVSFAYQKKIPLVGPASLLIDYQGTTSNSTSEKDAN